jgi:hypothetical protein
LIIRLAKENLRWVTSASRVNSCGLACRSPPPRSVARCDAAAALVGMLRALVEQAIYVYGAASGQDEKHALAAAPSKIEHALDLLEHGLGAYAVARADADAPAAQSAAGNT